MKTIALIIILGMGGAAAAGYKEAEGALKNMEGPQVGQISKELDALLLLPADALAKDARAAAFLSENQGAMELFRQAAEEPNDGYLLAPKPEKLSVKTPQPKFAAHTRLARLLIIEAKIKALQKQNALAEKDLLAAAGFLTQLSAQRSALILSSMVEQLVILKAAPAFAESLASASSKPAYLKELGARLEKVYKNQDFMRAAMLQEAEMSKGSIQEAVNPATMEGERAKLGFLQRLGAKKLQDQEFFSWVYRDYNAAVDAHAAVLVGAFRANDPAPVTAYLEKRMQEIKARKEARDKVGTFSGIIDGLKGGPQAKIEMARIIVDNMLVVGTPAYEKIIPRYHLFLTRLNVLRTALAVRSYQRAKKRLPDGLDQLVPGFLDAVPQDPFNKFAPLVYAKTGKNFRLYSFGPDGKDNGGAAALDYEAYFENPARDAGDIVFPG